MHGRMSGPMSSDVSNWVLSLASHQSDGSREEARRDRSRRGSWSRSRHVSGRGPDAAAPFCTSGRDVSAGRRTIEELYQMRRLTAFGEHLKERLEDTGPAQSPEPLPYAVPVAKFIGQCSPGNTVDGEIVDRLQEFTVVTSRLECTASNTSSAISQSRSVIPVSMSGSLMPVTQ